MEATLLAALQALLAAGASLYVWVFISQMTTPGLGWLQKGLRRSFLRPLFSCPWCFSWWACLALVVALQVSTGAVHWLMTPVSTLLAAAMSGFVGSLTPGIADLDEDE